MDFVTPDERELRRVVESLWNCGPGRANLIVALYRDSGRLVDDFCTDLAGIVAELSYSRQQIQPAVEGEELAKFRPGIYRHYKGRLYEATHLTHNASSGGRVEIYYVALEIDPSHEGPRHATREFREFLIDRVHEDGSKCECKRVDYPTHSEVCSAKPRFEFMGQVFQRWMIEPKG
ncbi:MAG TPA: hypothetical protein VLE72_01680 [Candidatus Saccharimonadales bacterium]|nr:hypothetical protein [Candidatus Saccharimonadales bacterium]